MDALKKLPRDAQIVLGAAALYFIFSFLDWQSYSIGPFSYGLNLWHGFGVVVALLAIVLIVWELVRAFEVNISLGEVSPGLISVVLAELLLLFTVIIFLDWSQFRAWPMYLGLVLSIVIGGFALRRARDEGVEVPSMPKSTSPGGADSAAASSASAPLETSAPETTEGQ